MGWRPPRDVRAGAAVACLLLVVAAGGGYAASQPARVLVVADADTGATLLSVPVADGDRVTLRYTHSVERTPVEDVYRVDDAVLDNELMRFQSYGWGLPAGANVTLEDGWFVFDPDRQYGEVYVKPGRVAGHELTVAGATYDLVALSNAETVRIAVERRGLVARLLR